MAFADPLFLSFAPSLFPPTFLCFQHAHERTGPVCLCTVNGNKAVQFVHNGIRNLRFIATLLSVCGLPPGGITN